MVTLEMRLPVDGRHNAEFLEMAQGLLEPIRTEEGCLGCRLYEDTERHHNFVLVQEWRDQTCLNRHIRGKRFRALLIAMDMLSGPPRVSLSHVSDQTVLPTIEELYRATRR